MNKVQKNKGINVLVQSDNSCIEDYWHGNKPVKITGVLSEDDLIHEWNGLEESQRMKIITSGVKSILEKRDGYAISNIEDKEQGIARRDIITFK